MEHSRPSLPLPMVLWRGFTGRCPHCGQGRVLFAYLRVMPHCLSCGEKLGHIRADDGPAYFTLFAVAHVVVPGALWVEQAWSPPLAPFVAATMAAALMLIGILLPAFKGATVALMWRLRLKGDEHQGDGLPSD